MEKVRLENSRTWSECNKEESNIKEWKMESASWKKCNMKQVPHDKNQPKKRRAQKKRNVEKV